MSLNKQLREDINRKILQGVAANEKNVVKTISEKFGISRQSVHKYMKKMIDENILEVLEDGKPNTYRLVTVEHGKVLPVPGLQEDVVWSTFILKELQGLSKNILEICNYGFTEMLNNAIDHSESPDVYVTVNRNALYVELGVCDTGVGIFNKIQKECGFELPQHAILELAKGKYTSDPEKHTGQGIFFTSRIFDSFRILSGELFFSSGAQGVDWLMESHSTVVGTTVWMRIASDSTMTSKEVFDTYASPDDDYSFDKTMVPVKLLDNEGGILSSRSQAKRLTTRFDRFKEVILDFKGVESIGQAFADELFRVFQNQHPEVHFMPINLSTDVASMIARVTHTK